MSMRRSASLVAVLVAVLVATPGNALAAPALLTGTAVASSGVHESSEVSMTTSYWSLAATSGVQGGQPDLTLTGPAGMTVGRSAEDFGVVDWVAVDNNSGRLPLGAYTAEVITATDGGRPTTHLTQFVGGDKVLAAGRPEAAVGFANGPWLVDIRDISLQAGRTVTFTVRGPIGSVSVLQSTSDPATWSRTRASAGLTQEMPKPDSDASTYTFTYTPPANGWYGVVFESRVWAFGPGGGYVTVSS